MRICVFCGSSSGARPAYTEAARRMGRLLAERGIGLVYGGGCVGLMGTVADSVLAQGGEAIGIIPGGLLRREVAHHGLTELRVVESMHRRKAMMSDLSQAFIALPGGYGTLEELCEIVTWSQLGIQAKPCGLLNVEHYWDSFLAVLDHATQEGFITPENRQLIQVGTVPEELLDKLLAWRPPPHIEKWIDAAER